MIQLIQAALLFIFVVSSLASVIQLKATIANKSGQTMFLEGSCNLRMPFCCKLIHVDIYSDILYYQKNKFFIRMSEIMFLALDPPTCVSIFFIFGPLKFIN